MPNRVRETNVEKNIQKWSLICTTRWGHPIGLRTQRVIRGYNRLAWEARHPWATVCCGYVWCCHYVCVCVSLLVLSSIPCMYNHVVLFGGAVVCLSVCVMVYHLLQCLSLLIVRCCVILCLVLPLLLVMLFLLQCFQSERGWHP